MREGRRRGARTWQACRRAGGRQPDRHARRPARAAERAAGCRAALLSTRPLAAARYGSRVLISDVMTHAVVSADVTDTLRHIGGLMRERNVGSVVVCDAGRPVGVITDRDLALAILAEDADPDGAAGDHASQPLVAGDVEMDLETAADLMIQHHIRRLPLLDGGELAGIVTIDDVAVRAGDLDLAQRVTAEVAKGAIPEFFFHRRGG